MKNLTDKEIKAGDDVIAAMLKLRKEGSWKDLYSPTGETPLDVAEFLHNKMEPEAWYVSDLKFSEDWDWLMRAYFVFQKQVKTFLNRDYPGNIAFCTDFITGIYNEDIAHSYRALVAGIEWHNTALASLDKNKKG